MKEQEEKELGKSNLIFFFFMQLTEKTVRRALCAHFHKSAAHFAHLFFGTVHLFLPAASQQLTRR